MGLTMDPSNRKGMSDEREVLKKSNKLDGLTEIGWLLNPLNRHNFPAARDRDTWRVSERAVLFPLWTKTRYLNIVKRFESLQSNAYARFQVCILELSLPLPVNF